MKFFNLDSPLMKFLGRMADLMWLNLLTVICCIPIVTAGASITAMHYVCLKMVRDEEGYITKDFFKSFKANFKQATLIWLMLVAVILIIFFDYKCIPSMQSGKKFLFGVVTASSVFVVITALYVFPILSHFVNTVKGTIKNAFFMSILALPKTALMIVITVSPIGLLLLMEYFGTAYWLIPLVTIFGVAVPAYFCAKLYDKTFKRFEPETEAAADDYSWSVSAEEGEENTLETSEEKDEDVKTEE